LGKKAGRNRKLQPEVAHGVCSAKMRGRMIGETCIIGETWQQTAE
jgi:hypothetical protein